MSTTSTTPRPLATPASQPPRRGGERLGRPRSTASSHTAGSAKSQTFDKAKSARPTGWSGSATIPASTPRLGAGTSSASASAALTFFEPRATTRYRALPVSGTRDAK